MNEFVWKFPSNDSNETEGPNDGGITHFTANRLANVVRESIQNSLDARSNENQAVRVAIDLTALVPESFDVHGLMAALDAAIISKHNDESHANQFKKGRALLASNPQKVTAMRIMDGNTTGANDDLSLDGKPTKWEALTKSNGLSVKDQKDAGGSYGLGKHAPFAVTDIRTVLYSTCWLNKGQFHRRFQGKAILVSHGDAHGAKYRRTGYLGAENFCPVEDNEVPQVFRLDEPGLAVYIPGWTPEADWQNKSVGVAIDNFFHAIIHKGLEVTIDGNSVTDSTLDDYLHLSNSRTLGFINASRSAPVAETDIRDIGHVTLRLVFAQTGIVS